VRFQDIAHQEEEWDWSGFLPDPPHDWIYLAELSDTPGGETIYCKLGKTSRIFRRMHELYRNRAYAQFIGLGFRETYIIPCDRCDYWEGYFHDLLRPLRVKAKGTRELYELTNVEAAVFNNITSLLTEDLERTIPLVNEFASFIRRFK
jgi:hypothetical protein